MVVEEGKGLGVREFVLSVRFHRPLDLT